MKLAGKGILKRLGEKGGKEIAQSALPGSILTGILGGITTGNPLAGLAIGAADFGLSAGAARLMAKSPRLAGKYSGSVSAKDLEAAELACKPVDAAKVQRTYTPSLAKNIAMIGGSVAAPVVLEPMFLGQRQTINDPEAYGAPYRTNQLTEEEISILMAASQQER